MPTSKAIKVTEEVYDELDRIRGKGETFSDIIAGFLRTRTKIFHLLNTLEGELRYNEWKARQLRQLQENDGRGAGPEVRSL